MAAGLAAAGQELNGAWSGSIEAGGAELALVFHISEGKCRLEVPAQGAWVEADMTVENGGLKINIPKIGAKYEGSYFMGAIMGTFTQLGTECPLTLKPGKPVPKRPQTPMGMVSYSFREVTFESGDAALSGTLTTPENAGLDIPILLMVSGSGMQDRDETIMDHRPFAVIAHAFVNEGIGTLRYDDRGVRKSTGNFESATTDTFAEDALAGLNYLRSLGYTKVGLLGHSEGGTIAFMLAASEGGPDFIISMAGMAEDGETTLLAQAAEIAVVQGLPEEQAKPYAKQMVASTKATANIWMKRFLELDPKEYIAKVTCPTLALNGEKDLQVIAERNIPIIKELIPSATTKVYPGLNHLFQHCTTGNPTEYYSIEETISPEVLTDMIEWIKQL